MQAYEIDAGNPVIGFNLASVLAQREEWSRAQFYIRRVNNSAVGQRRDAVARHQDRTTAEQPRGGRAVGEANCNDASPSRGRQRRTSAGISMIDRVSEFGASAAVPLEGGDSTHKTAGDLLREAREAHGLHIEMVAAALKVPPQKLMALEADDIASLPDPVFARALASQCLPCFAHRPGARACEAAQARSGVGWPRPTEPFGQNMHSAARRAGTAADAPAGCRRAAC